MNQALIVTGGAIGVLVFGFATYAHACIAWGEKGYNRAGHAIISLIYFGYVVAAAGHTAKLL